MSEAENIRKLINLVEAKIAGAHRVGGKVPNVTTVDLSAPWVKKQAQKAADVTIALKDAKTSKEVLDIVTSGPVKNYSISFMTIEMQRWGSPGTHVHKLQSYDPETGEIIIRPTEQGSPKVVTTYKMNIDDFTYVGRERTGNKYRYDYELNGPATNKIETPDPKFADRMSKQVDKMKATKKQTKAKQELGTLTPDNISIFNRVPPKR